MKIKIINVSNISLFISGFSKFLQKKRSSNKILTLFITILFIGTSFLPTISGSVNKFIDINPIEKQKKGNNDNIR